MESQNKLFQAALIALSCLVTLPSIGEAATKHRSTGKTSHHHGTATRRHTPTQVEQFFADSRGIVSISGAGSIAHAARPARYAGSRRSPYSNAMLYTSGAGDYVSQTEGVSRWPQGEQIRVYVAPGRPSFAGIVANSFNQWSQASGGRIRYTLVSNPGNANYTFSWTAHQHEASDGTEAGLTTTDTFVDDSGSEYIDHAQTKILTRYDGRALSDKEIADTVLHEIGHGLGIEGHSSNASDIMYYAVSAKQSGHLTPRDANTIARLYSY